MLSVEDFQRLRLALGVQAEDDIAWAEGCCPPDSAIAFAREAIFVICNSGMKHTVARRIFERVMVALQENKPVASVFGHKGKAAAIESLWAGRENMWKNYLNEKPDHKLEYLAGIPWIGHITKYHLGKNFGLPLAKPDVHLQRLADRECTTAQALCERLSAATGLGVNAVDTVLWRACATGIMNSRTGEISAPGAVT